MLCASCGEPVEKQDYKTAIRDGTLEAIPSQLTRCFECFMELHFGHIPQATTPSLKPAHTGLTDRQRQKLGHTDGG